MSFTRNIIGPLDQRDVIGRMIFSDTVDKIPIEVLRTVVLPYPFNLIGVDGDPASLVYLPFAVIPDTPLPTIPGYKATNTREACRLPEYDVIVMTYCYRSVCDRRQFIA